MIGVSVAVPEPWGQMLQDYRVRLGDHVAHGIPTHVTLLPPVEVDEATLPAVSRHLEEVGADTDPFELHLRGTGTFRPVSPVVFINVVRGISSCEQLASRVRQGPLAVTTRFPYHPHVTVAHDLDDAVLDRAFEELERFDCRFTVEHISLYFHHAGTGWAPAHEFALGVVVGPTPR